MTILLDTVEKQEVNKNEITFYFKTKSASFQEGGGGMMGVRLPDDLNKVDFTMNYKKINQIDGNKNMQSGTYNCLSFVTFPKLIFNELKGILKGKKSHNIFLFYHKLNY
jgi:hypothetical protein